MTTRFQLTFLRVSGNWEINGGGGGLWVAFKVAECFSIQRWWNSYKILPKSVGENVKAMIT